MLTQYKSSAATVCLLNDVYSIYSLRNVSLVDRNLGGFTQIVFTLKWTTTFLLFDDSRLWNIVAI